MRKTKLGAVYRGAGAVILASVFNHFCDRLLGVTIEGFTGGIGYFSPLWVVDMFLVPFLAGMMVSLIYGFGGKWLSYSPPLIVRCISYFGILYHAIPLPPGSSLMPMGWWGFYVILALESAAVGGVIGEVVIRRTYGRAAGKKAVEQARPIHR